MKNVKVLLETTEKPILCMYTHIMDYKYYSPLQFQISVDKIAACVSPIVWPEFVYNIVDYFNKGYVS